MNDYWIQQFRDRMEGFAGRRGDGLALSIKIRGEGCFCRNCSPNTHRTIERIRETGDFRSREVEIEEHETGPEFLVYLALGTAAITLAKSVVELITAVVKARAEENEPHKVRGPSVIVVRTVSEGGRFMEREALRIEPGSPPTSEEVETSLNDAIELIAEEWGKNRD